MNFTCDECGKLIDGHNWIDTREWECRCRHAALEEPRFLDRLPSWEKLKLVDEAASRYAETVDRPLPQGEGEVMEIKGKVADVVHWDHALSHEEMRFVTSTTKEQLDEYNVLRVELAEKTLEVSKLHVEVAELKEKCARLEVELNDVARRQAKEE